MKRGSHEQGASAVEFALILPILVLFVFGIIEFGLTFFRAQGMEAAAREGGRVAAIGLAGDDVYDIVRSSLGGVPVRADDLVVCIGDGEGQPGTCGSSAPDLAAFEGCSDERVRVDVGVSNPDSYGLSIPFVNLPTPDLSASAIFRCEVTS